MNGQSSYAVNQSYTSRPCVYVYLGWQRSERRGRSDILHVEMTIHVAYCSIEQEDVGLNHLQSVRLPMQRRPGTSMAVLCIRLDQSRESTRITYKGVSTKIVQM